MTRCPLCNEAELRPLPIGLTRSMRSDGLILEEPLRKLACQACGALIGANSSPERPYRRSNGKAPSDIARHARVAEGIKAQIKRLGLSGPVLEIGAASFETAIHLAALSPEMRVVAIEPEPESVPPQTTIEIHLGAFDDYAVSEPFGTIYSNHVLEHVPNTHAFLMRISRTLAPEGVALLVTPCGLMPSHELLFSDHLYHFTPRSVAVAAARANLALLESMPCPWEPLSRLFVIGRGSESIPEPPNDLTGARLSYISAWVDAEAQLLPVLGEAPLLFGAGEFSQLIRAYLPSVFDRIEAIIVDDLSGTRAFDLPMLQLSTTSLRDRTILLGVRPESVPVLRERLYGLGARRLLTVPLL
jgi:SAM-dependent methyltransferase